MMRRRADGLWRLFAAVVGVGLAALILGWVTAVHAQIAPCDPIQSNPVACENSNPGNPPSEWDIGSSSGDPSIQGFATDISVNVGQTVRFKINTNASAYRIDIYRMGYYAGMGARRMATSIQLSAPLPQTQPACLTDGATGLIDCGNWAESASWVVPSNAASGIYFARLTRLDTLGASHIFFVVRNDAGNSAVLFQTSDPTWQAYNNYGGNSLYGGTAPAGRAYKVSYNRPFSTRNNSITFLFSAEYPMVRWLEANGYDVSYTTGVDSERNGSLILRHKVFLSVGHDEYWSGGQRANVETARRLGVHLAFFSGNELFWKTRWEPSIDGSGTPYRTLVCYKETLAGQPIDPSDPPTWTGTWRDPRFSPPADGGHPENALTGTLYAVNSTRNDAIQVPAAYGNLRFWRNTAIATLAPGTTYTMPAGTLGYEWDEDRDNGFRPDGSFPLSSTTVNIQFLYLLDWGSNYGSGTPTHSLTLYRHSSGALVFGAGTVQWSWGLDSNHDNGGLAPDRNMQQATVNLLADMGVQPVTLQPGLAAAAASTDTTAPTSSITSPTAGSTVQMGRPVTITGTATDTGGGVVAAVEVSVDGGATWQRATGRATWSYTWTPGGALGPVTIKSSAIDDSGNIETPSAGVTVTVNPPSCPCSIWSNTTTPAVASQNDSNPVELGVRFRSDLSGYITAIRFYKGSANTGTHTGHLWTNTGTLLASVTFAGETASGWQQATLSTPVAIAANTTYVVSYYAPAGGYAVNLPYFASSFNTPPLHALADGLDGPNGVYRYGASGFPTNTYQSSNYWVDVVFNTTAPGSPPTVTSVSPASGASGVAVGTKVTATFSKAMNAATISGSTFQLRDPANALVAATVTYDGTTFTATLQPTSPLAASTTYTATVIGGATGVKDQSGNALAANFTWSFTTSATSPTCPCTIWSGATTPAVASQNDSNPVELGVRFRSDLSGSITAIRFYKGPANTGTHTGHLWTNTGTLLASVTFAGETASGWQQATLSTPVAIAANTTYVVSYYAPAGGWAVNLSYFATSSFNSPPLHALADGLDGPNGVYRYGASGFPTNTYQSSNYWVDVVFTGP